MQKSHFLCDSLLPFIVSYQHIWLLNKDVFFSIIDRFLTQSETEYVVIKCKPYQLKRPLQLK